MPLGRPARLVAFALAAVCALAICLTAEQLTSFLQRILPVSTRPRHLRPRQLVREALPHQHQEEHKRVAVNPDGSVRFYNPDFETIGRLRGLGRLLVVAGEKLMDASSVVASNSRLESFIPTQACLHGCGVSLRDVAVALVQERWTEADGLICATQGKCGTFLPREHLAVLQRLLGDSQKFPDVGKALKALSSVLEVHAEGPSRVCSSLQDTFVEAAGVLRSAARLCAAQPQSACHAVAGGAAEEFPFGGLGPLGAAAMRERVPPNLARELERELARAPEGGFDTVLRMLARKYHPDRHKGREAEVLPAFLFVQQLREHGAWSRTP